MFVTDLHGRIDLYERLFGLVEEKRPDAVFLGGDLFPSGFGTELAVVDFLQGCLFAGLERASCAKEPPRWFVIMGNDDPRHYETHMLEAQERGLLDYVSDRVVLFGDMFVCGYSYVPPTPFRLKDWEKYDVSRFVDVGAVSPEDGARTVDVSESEIRHGTIAKDLEKLASLSPPERTIYLFHSPPYGSLLDLADIQGLMVDSAPVDQHIGSIAIQRFIGSLDPFLTLHGHAHESTRLSGSWSEQGGATFSMQGAHDGDGLAVIFFDASALDKAQRIVFR